MKQRKKKSVKTRTILAQQPKTIKRKILGLLHSDEFTEDWTIMFSDKRLEWDNTWGEAEVERRVITISPQNNLFDWIDTFIHEMLHVLVGTKGHEAQGYTAIEDQIKAATKSVVAVLSPLETQMLLATLFRVAVWDE